MNAMNMLSTSDLQSNAPTGPSPGTRRRLLQKALAARFVEEKLLDLFSEGRLHGTVHTCIGQEMSAVVLDSLGPEDTVFSNHRCHGHFLFRTDDVEGLIAELMGRATGVCGGIGGSQHLYKDGFFSNGIQGGIVPVATGLALAHKLEGKGGISVVFIGDGTLGEGVVYEAFNIASKWQLPLLVVLEDNRYSQSTAQHETLAGDICARAHAFGIETDKLDTWNWEELHHRAASIISTMRRTGGPRFLHVETFRLKAHSKGDDLRPRELIESFEKLDPLNIFLRNLAEEDASWVDSLRKRVLDAVDRAATAPLALIPRPDDSQVERVWEAAEAPQNKRFVTTLNETFVDLMRDHPKVIFFGEDVLVALRGGLQSQQGSVGSVSGSRQKHTHLRKLHCRNRVRSRHTRLSPNRRDHVRRFHRHRVRPDRQSRRQVRTDVQPAG